LFKLRPVPVAYVEVVREETQRNVLAGIFQRIDTSEWTASIVLVKKNQMEKYVFVKILKLQSIHKYG
jgi:hypothetical protein